MFLTAKDLRRMFEESTKKPLMGRFYENQRKSQNILMNPDGTLKAVNGV